MQPCWTRSALAGDGALSRGYNPKGLFVLARSGFEDMADTSSHPETVRRCGAPMTPSVLTGLPLAGSPRRGTLGGAGLFAPGWARHFSSRRAATCDEPDHRVDRGGTVFADLGRFRVSAGGRTTASRPTPRTDASPAAPEYLRLAMQSLPDPVGRVRGRGGSLSWSRRGSAPEDGSE